MHFTSSDPQGRPAGRATPSPPPMTASTPSRSRSRRPGRSRSPPPTRPPRRITGHRVEHRRPGRRGSVAEGHRLPDAPITAGTAGTFTVTAYDAYGNVATGYTGTVHFTSSDPQAVLPARLHLHRRRRGDAHLHRHARDGRVRSRSPRPTRPTRASPAPSRHHRPGRRRPPALTVTRLPDATRRARPATSPSPPTIPMATWPPATPARSTSPAATPGRPAGHYTFIAADAAAHLRGHARDRRHPVDHRDRHERRRASPVPRRASRSSRRRPVAHGHRLPGHRHGGHGARVTVTAYDAYGNVATGYTGTVTFTSSDGQAALPASYTFTAADAGTHTFSVTLETAGTQSITATDQRPLDHHRSETGIVVQAAAAQSLESPASRPPTPRASPGPSPSPRWTPTATWPPATPARST